MSANDAHVGSVSFIREAGERATRLNRHLLAVSRPSRQRPELSDVNEVLEESHNVFQRMIGAGATLKAQLSSETLFIRADHANRNQVIMNILLNACDACTECGEIMIRTTAVALSAQDLPRAKLPERDFTCVEISDNGTGISSETCFWIFEPCFSMKGNRTTFSFSA